MNFRSVTLGLTSITLVVSDGRSLTITYAEIKSRYDAASGSPTAKKGAVLNWALDQWEAAFGTGTFSRSFVVAADFDTSTGRVTVFTLAGPGA